MGDFRFLRIAWRWGGANGPSGRDRGPREEGCHMSRSGVLTPSLTVPPYPVQDDSAASEGPMIRREEEETERKCLQKENTPDGIS